jgi:hypothetical protein
MELRYNLFRTFEEKAALCVTDVGHCFLRYTLRYRPSFDI